MVGKPWEDSARAGRPGRIPEKSIYVSTGGRSPAAERKGGSNLGTLANSFFQLLMGWVRILATQVYTSVSSPNTRTLVGWIGRNWKMLAILLCAVGLIVDLLVYLFRWQPLRVWRSFFRRMRHRREERRLAAEQAEEEEEITAGRRGAEGVPEPAYAEAPGPGPESRRYFDAEETAPGGSEESDRVAWRRTEPGGTTPVFEEAIRPRRRRVTRFLTDANREETVSPDQLIDQYAAYRRPVYPRSWKADEGDEGDQE